MTVLTRTGDLVLQVQRRSIGGLSSGGVVSALFGLFASLTPSLLPRPWVMQGMISGLVVVAFYPVGVAAEWVARRIAAWIELDYSIAERARRLLSIGWFVLAVGLYLSAQAISLSWQRESARLVGAPEPGAGYVIGSLLVTTLVFLVILMAYRGIHWAVTHADRLGRKVLPAVLSRVLATAAVLVLVLVLVDRLVLAPIVQVAERSSLATDSSRPAGVDPPTSPLRSGSPASPESWKSLGTEGAMFVSRGPSAADITQLTGAQALEPIRVYAGLGKRSLQQVADAVVAEMDRTGAFERSAILIYTTTGTGWVNEWHASAFEYLGGGDTVVAAMQYSRFPSALALLADIETPRHAGRLLYETVTERIAELPAGSRPKVYLGGESLGAYGAQATFDTPEDLLAAVDGAVWSGTPGFTPLHQVLTAQRMPGSTAVNPVIDNGLHYRFAANQAELSADQFGRPLGPWQAPRVTYLQHPSDPVVWWDMSLFFGAPDWIEEPPGADVTGRIRFVPIATMLQVSADMAVAQDVRPGHGHVYQDELVPAWAGVLGLDPQVDYAAIIAEIRSVNPAT